MSVHEYARRLAMGEMTPEPPKTAPAILLEAATILVELAVTLRDTAALLHEQLEEKS